MRRLLLALLLAATARGHAQSLAAVFDAAALGYAEAQVRVVELGGNPSTVELLAVRHSDGAYSVGTPSCAGPWFNPRAGLPLSWLSSVVVERVQGRDALFVRDLSGGVIYVVALNLPPCR